MNSISNMSKIDLITKLPGDSELLSLKNKKVNNTDSFAMNFNSALEELSNLENSDSLREMAIKNGKSVIKNWTPPTDKQIDYIFSNIKKSFIAG